MTEITNTTQLSTFDTVKSILLNNSTISSRFKSSSIYQFEPNIKSLSNSVPYIVIEIPTTDTDLLVFSKSTVIKQFDIPILMVIDYNARSKVIDYANIIINQLESNVSTLQDLGYIDLNINLEDTRVEVINQKQVITCEFMLSLQGYVFK